jgi:predicted ATPase/DNA-binding SARP family transcriptional activator
MTVESREVMRAWRSSLVMRVGNELLLRRESNTVSRAAAAVTDLLGGGPDDREAAQYAGCNVEFAILGPLEVRAATGAVPIRRGLPRTLLISLLLRPGQTVSSDMLVELLWGDDLPRNPANALQIQISYLRKALAGGEPEGTGVLETRAGGYAFVVDPSSVDAHRFEQAIHQFEQIESLRSTESLTAALNEVESALSLWRGDALEDVADAQFARGEITRLDELRWAATERRIDLLLRLGRHGEAVGLLAELVQRLPLRERFHEQFVLALYRSGRQAEALRAYEDARRTLVEELGLDPGRELRQLEQAVLRHDPALDWAPPAAIGIAGPPMETVSPTPATPASSTGRLPIPVSALIGRDDEVTRVADLLLDHRALTLTGPAGAGKTRLAIAVAARESADSVWYVDLSPIDDPSLVGATCAAATGVTLSPGDDPAAVIANTLSVQRGLVVLDTCEHVLTAAAQLASTLLRSCPDVRVLATSRRALGLSGEFAWPIPPLELPPPDAAAANDITSRAAVKLFIDRARAVRPDLTVDDRTAVDIAAICMALDGLPLAIELAAARADLLSPAAIRARLADRFDLLVEGGVDASQRQQTLRAAIDWSHELLSTEQRSFFARLGVFAGGFDLDAALAVAGSGLPHPLDLLGALVKQSMVARAGNDRYRLLDTLRAYALDALAELDADDTRARHAAYFTDLAEQGEIAIRGPDQAEWLERFRNDINNLRAALEWSLTTGDIDRAARQAGALAWFWTLNGMLTEAIDHLGRLVGLKELPADARSKCTWGYALLAASLGHLETARDAGYTAAELGRECRDPASTAYGLNAAALAEWALGHHDRSLEAHREAIELLTKIDDQWGLAVCKILQARTLFDRREARAGDVAHEGVDHARRSGDLHILGIALTQIADLAIGDGNPTQAIVDATEALRLQEQIGYTEGAISALHVLGHAHRASGDADTARGIHRRALSLAARIGHAAAMCEAMEDLARTEASTQSDLAAMLLRAARAERAARGMPLRQRDAEEISELEANLLASISPTGDDPSFSGLVTELTT